MLVLRLALAAVFIYHGSGKVNAGTDWGRNWNPKLPVWQQAAVSWGELTGGGAMVIGLLTRLAALGLAVIMGGAIVTVHGANGFALPTGFEYAFVLLMICVALILCGGGSYSVDALFRRKPRPV
jgi:putative oxidoreductase